MSKRITDLPSGSISDSSLGFIGDPNTGALTETSYHAMKDYFLSGSFLLNTGSYVTTTSFFALSSSYHNDSSSFAGSINNLIASQSGFVLLSTYNTSSASYHVDSASFNTRISNISSSMLSGSFTPFPIFNSFTSSYKNDSSSFVVIYSNIFASQSGYLLTSSFQTYSGSVKTDSSSFDLRINNIISSQSGLLPTASFNTFSSSYVGTSASINTQLINTLASESNYLLTSSINFKNSYVPLFTGSGFTFSNIFQSGSSILINQVTSPTSPILGIGGPVAINDTTYLLLPVGTTLQRPTGSSALFGMIRANSDSSSIEYCLGGNNWVTFGVSSGSLFPTGSVSSVALSLPTSIFNVGGSPGVGIVNLSASLITQSAGLFFASPSGSNGVPIFRALTITDISPLTASFIAGYVLTSSFNPYSASVSVESASFNLRINNVLASESNYTPTSSFNTLSSSISTLSSSFLGLIGNVYASESNYTQTSSFNSFSASYVNTSASINVQIANTLASESNYLPTSSVNGKIAFIPVFVGTTTLSSSGIYQSGSSVVVGSATGSNQASLQVPGTAWFQAILDSTGVTGSNGQVIGAGSNGLVWINTGSVGWSTAGNTVASGAFLGTVNAQDLILKRNGAQVAIFAANNNVSVGNPTNVVTGSNAAVVGGNNNFAANMASVLGGAFNTASGNSSAVVAGGNSVAQGLGSVVLGGTNLSASAAYVIVGGRFNNPVSSSTAGAWVNGDPLFILGNGSSTGSLSNAFVVYKTGSVSLPYYANSFNGILIVDSNGNVGLISGSSLVAGYVTTSSFNLFSSSYNSDSASFDSRISAISSSVLNLTGSYVVTGSFNNYTASVAAQLANIYASESNYLPSTSISGSPNFIPVFTGIKTIGNSRIIEFGTNHGVNTNAPSYNWHVYGSTATGYLLVTGSGVGGDGTQNGITMYLRPTTVTSNSFAQGIQEYSSVTANTGFYAYAGIQSWGYITGRNPGTAGGRKFTNYIMAFSAGQTWDGSGGGPSITASRLDNAIGYFSALNSQTGSIVNAYDVYASELNSIFTTTFPPTVSNHYAFYAEPFISASNNWGVFINGNQSNYFGGKLLIGASSSVNNAIVQVRGNIYLSGSVYDSFGNTGSLGQALVSVAGGIQWQNVSGSSSGSVSTGSNTQPIDFIVGDGQSFTPFSGSTIFSSSLLVGKTVLQVWQESFLLAPLSRSVGWYTFTSSVGKINLQNATFDTSSYYQILYR